MEIELVLNKNVVATLRKVEELKLLKEKYSGKMPYQVILITDNDNDIRELQKLGIKFRLEWAGAWC